MIEFKELYDIIYNKLSEHRFLHVNGVVKRAIEYAEKYDIDIEIVKLTALAHDIAKELSLEEMNEYINKYNIELDDIEKINHNLLHAKVGAAICKYEYGFTEDMVNAVRYHTTGRANMSLLEKIIYLADATEENRKYSSLPYYVTIIKENIDKGIVEVDKWVINNLIENNKMIHLNSIDCYNYYINVIAQKEL